MRKIFTGPDIHAAFVKANEKQGKPALVDFMAKWEMLYPKSKDLYGRMADFLNALLEVRERTCSVCGKSDPSGYCQDCQQYFCGQHFLEHQS